MTMLQGRANRVNFIRQLVVQESKTLQRKSLGEWLLMERDGKLWVAGWNTGPGSDLLKSFTTGLQLIRADCASR